MKKTTELIKTANSFNRGLASQSIKILNFVYISLAIFISYAVSMTFILIFDIGKNMLIFAFSLFILSTLIVFNFIKKSLYKRIYKNGNPKIYFLISLALLMGVIITALISSYYMNLYFKTSVFDREEYLKHYDFKAKDIIKISLPLTLVISLFALLVYETYILNKRGIGFSKSLKFGLSETLKLFFNILIFYLITFILAFIIFIIVNLSGPWG